ncbi:MAG: hypothetical protein BroJett014_32170 [Planctomycetota bacterium]|nr:hypothetical protein [Planctomycetota bacterium]GIK54244.1 MAG: hypothetical protein BroJett014_32170 [Planctomycetota bacterium]
MRLAWREYDHPDHDRSKHLIGTAAPDVDALTCRTAFDEMFGKLFALIGQSGEIMFKRSVTCVVDLASGDFTVFAVTDRKMEWKGVGVTLHIPHLLNATTKLFDATNGADPFDEEIERLGDAYLVQLRQSFSENRPPSIDSALSTVDPEGEDL